MIIRELMTGALITADPDMSILDARQLMVTEKIRHLLVRRGQGELLGIVTDRDIRLNLPSKTTSCQSGRSTICSSGDDALGHHRRAGPPGPRRRSAHAGPHDRRGAGGGRRPRDRDHHRDGHRASLRNDDGPAAAPHVLTDAGAGS
jgi:hypothetical protein